ncbi:MAG: hypothetical protein K1X94_08985 [Sandaracinaceae bacterium]|jgi:hypothetical protein|nr:hypothetical protein [Sandaracinaceae bacterium]
MTALRYEIALTDDELRTAWLTEDRARRGFLRRSIGPALVVFGLGTLVSQPDGTARLLGIAAVAWGLFQLARPFLVVAQVLKERRARGGDEVTVVLDDDGIALTRQGKSMRAPWKDVTAAGQRDTYVWYELRGQHRAPIPLRVVPDAEALRALLREKTRWVA